MATQSRDVDRIATSRAPRAIGPYCQATAFGDLVFCSGQIPLDPRTGVPVEGDLQTLTHRCLTSLASVCEAAGTSLDRALKLTLYLRDMAGFADVNAAYKQFFDGDVPARTTIEVSGLPAGAEIEIDAIVAR